jgi:lysozyme family protein
LKENFTRALDFVLKWEGGYIFDPADPGGETNFGISKKAHPDLNIKGLTREEAEGIYFSDYWGACRCDSIHWPGDLIVFDTAVNLGTITARVFQIKAKKDWSAYLSFRETYYKKLSGLNPTFQKFLKGWINRVAELRKEAGLV